MFIQAIVFQGLFLSDYTFYSNQKTPRPLWVQPTCSINLNSLPCCLGGNDDPLKYSCLENPVDGRAWWALVYGVKEVDTTEVTKHTHHCCLLSSVTHAPPLTPPAPPGFSPGLCPCSWAGASGAET